MAKRPETNAEWIEHYENLRAQNELNYQDSGEARYLKAQIKYETLVDALRALEEKKEERDNRLRYRISHSRKAIEQLGDKEEFTREEVERLLRDAVERCCVLVMEGR